MFSDKAFARSDFLLFFLRYIIIDTIFTVLPVKKLKIYLLTDSSINNLNGNSVVTMATKVNCKMPGN